MRNKKNIVILTSYLMGVLSLDICAEIAGSTAVENNEPGFNGQVINKGKERQNLSQKQDNFNKAENFKKKQNSKKKKKKFNKKFNIVKKFKKEDYEIKEFNLKVYKMILKGNKNFRNRYVLSYEHKETGAYFVIFLLEEDEIKYLDRFTDRCSFRNIITNKSGINHSLEHLLVGGAYKDSIRSLINPGMEDFIDKNGITDFFGVVYYVNSSLMNKEVLEKNFIRAFNNKIFKDDEKMEYFKNYEIYNVKNICGVKFPVGRVFYEILKQKEAYNRYIKTHYKDYLSKKEDLNDYLAGNFEELSKITIKDLVKAYREVVHPSNCLIQLNMPKSPKQVKAYLKMFDKCFRKYKKRKINEQEDREKLKKLLEIIESGYALDEKIKVYKGDNCFEYTVSEGKNKEEIKSAKYYGEFTYKLGTDNETLKKKCILRSFKNNVVENLLKEEYKKLGYEKVTASFNDDAVNFFFYGNDEKQFKKSVVQQNVKFLLTKLIEKIKKAPKSSYGDFFADFDEEILKSINDSMQESSLFLAQDILSKSLKKSFDLYNKPLDERIINLDGDEIRLDPYYFQKLIIENIDKLDLLLKPLEKGEKTYYSLLEQTEEESPIPKKKDENRKFRSHFFLEIYFKNMQYDDLCEERYIRFLFERILGRYILENGLSYFSPICFYIHDKPGVKKNCGSDKNKETIKKFFKSGVFDKIIKEIEIPKEELEEGSKKYLECLEYNILKMNDIKQKYKDIISKLDKKLERLSSDDLFKVYTFFGEIAHVIDKIAYYKTEKEVELINEKFFKMADWLDMNEIYLCEKNKDKVSKEKAERDFTKMCNDIYLLFKELINNTIEFNKDCIKYLTDEKGNLKPCDYEKIVDKIRKIEYDEIKDLRYDVLKKKEEKKLEKQKN